MMPKRLLLGMLLFVMLPVGTSPAGVDVDIHVGLPLPRVVIAGPPLLVVYPGTYVYVATDVDMDLVFYHDHWYRPYGGGWYVSLSYNGPWKVAAAPLAVRRLPQNFRALPPGHQRMPFGQVKQNWKTWEKERHWDRPGKGGVKGGGKGNNGPGQGQNRKFRKNKGHGGGGRGNHGE